MIITTSAPRRSRPLLVTVYIFRPLTLASMHDNWNYRACRPGQSRAICRPDWTELATKSPGLYPRSRTFRGVRCSRRGVAGNSPVSSHGCKLSPFVAEGVAGKPGLFPLGRKLYFGYSSQGGEKVQEDGLSRLQMQRLAALEAAVTQRQQDEEDPKVRNSATHQGGYPAQAGPVEGSAPRQAAGCLPQRHRQRTGYFQEHGQEVRRLPGISG